jgi:hypothetical protein
MRARDSDASDSRWAPSTINPSGPCASACAAAPDAASTMSAAPTPMSDSSERRTGAWFWVKSHQPGQLRRQPRQARRPPDAGECQRPNIGPQREQVPVPRLDVARMLRALPGKRLVGDALLPLDRLDDRDEIVDAGGVLVERHEHSTHRRDRFHYPHGLVRQQRGFDDVTQPDGIGPMHAPDLDVCPAADLRHAAPTATPPRPRQSPKRRRQRQRAPRRRQRQRHARRHHGHRPSGSRQHHRVVGSDRDHVPPRHAGRSVRRGASAGSG